MSSAVDAQVSAWLQELEREPDQVPSGLEVVARRLVRCVARGALPDGSAYLKWMTFPRFRDRIRYVHRALPAVHEARMIEAVRDRLGGAVQAPEVLAVRGVRRGRWPAVSVLITRALDLAADPRPALVEVAEVGARLAEHGVLHRDLHPGNVLRLRSGGVAVLDLQSARLRRGGPSRTERLAMAERLLLHVDTARDAVAGLRDAAELLAEGGLIDLSDIGVLVDRVQRERVANLRRRVRRCFGESTQFERRFGLVRWVHRRRGVDVAMIDAVEVPAELGRRLWIGDRALEVTTGGVSRLAELELRGCWPLGRRARLRPRAGEGGRAWRLDKALEQELCAAHGRFLAIQRGEIEPPAALHA